MMRRIMATQRVLRQHVLYASRTGSVRASSSSGGGSGAGKARFFFNDVYEVELPDTHRFPVRARPGRLSVLSVLHSKPGLYGVFCMGAAGAYPPKTAVSGPGQMEKYRLVRELLQRRHAGDARLHWAVSPLATPAEVCHYHTEQPSYHKNRHIRYTAPFSNQRDTGRAGDDARGGVRAAVRRRRVHGAREPGGVARGSGLGCVVVAVRITAVMSGSTDATMRPNPRWASRGARPPWRARCPRLVARCAVRRASERFGVASASDWTEVTRARAPRQVAAARLACAWAAHGGGAALTGHVAGGTHHAFRDRGTSCH